MAVTFFYGWFFVALFIFICIMGLLIRDRRARAEQDRIEIMIRESERKG